MSRDYVVPNTTCQLYLNKKGGRGDGGRETMITSAGDIRHSSQTQAFLLIT